MILMNLDKESSWNRGYEQNRCLLIEGDGYTLGTYNEGNVLDNRSSVDVCLWDDQELSEIYQNDMRKEWIDLVRKR